MGERFIKIQKIFVQGLISAVAHIEGTEQEDIGTKDTVEEDNKVIENKGHW